MWQYTKFWVFCSSSFYDFIFLRCVQRSCVETGDKYYQSRISLFLFLGLERGALVAGSSFLYGVGAKCRAGIIAYTSKCLNSPGLYYVAKYIFTGCTGVHEYQMGRRRALRTCRYSRSALAGAQGNRTKCRHHSSYFSPPPFLSVEI